MLPDIGRVSLEDAETGRNLRGEHVRPPGARGVRQRRDHAPAGTRSRRSCAAPGWMPSPCARTRIICPRCVRSSSSASAASPAAKCKSGQSKRLVALARRRTASLPVRSARVLSAAAGLLSCLLRLCPARTPRPLRPAAIRVSRRTSAPSCRRSRISLSGSLLWLVVAAVSLLLAGLVAWYLLRRPKTPKPAGPTTHPARGCPTAGSRNSKHGWTAWTRGLSGRSVRRAAGLHRRRIPHAAPAADLAGVSGVGGGVAGFLAQRAHAPGRVPGRLRPAQVCPARRHPGRQARAAGPGGWSSSTQRSRSSPRLLPPALLPPRHCLPANADRPSASAHAHGSERSYRKLHTGSRIFPVEAGPPACFAYCSLAVMNWHDLAGFGFAQPGAGSGCCSPARPCWRCGTGRAGGRRPWCIRPRRCSSRSAVRGPARAGAFSGVLLALATAAGVLALARPQLSNSFTQVEASGIDIMIALDVSRSMLTEDFQIGGQPRQPRGRHQGNHPALHRLAAQRPHRHARLRRAALSRQSADARPRLAHRKPRPREDRPRRGRHGHRFGHRLGLPTGSRTARPRAASSCC